MQKQIVKEEGKSPKGERRPYSQPRIVKHGQVESLTLGGEECISRPWNWDLR